MLTVGLTGGIGSGKSTVARLLVGHGALLVDADAIAREVVAPGTPGLAAVVDAFGPDVLRPDGALDRERLGRLVFADAAALARLNAIVHPLVGERGAVLVEQARAEGAQVVVHDVPLLVENGLAALYDVIVVVDAPDDVRLARLEERGLPRDQAQARMAAQASRDDRLAAADELVDNAGTLERLQHEVALLWSRLLRRASEMSPYGQG